MEKLCELCKSTARMYCESDQASLCWECDSTVHSANFLVAKHSRTLLCHSCHSLTPWSGSGPRLGPGVSFCHSCTSGKEDSNTHDDDHDDDDDQEEEEEEEDDDNDDGENQVVPMSCSSSSSMIHGRGEDSADSSSGEGYPGRVFGDRERRFSWRELR